MAFAPITRTTVSSQIREQLLDRITTGDLVPGSRVPSERELSEQFDVARTSVREAIQGLLSLGVVERRGNRTWVAEQLPEVSVNGRRDTEVFVRQLFETRWVLEGPTFALAAARADDDAKARVIRLLEQFHEPLTIAEFRRLDREFHSLIASACGNPLLIELYGKVLDQLFRSAEFESLLSDTRNADTIKQIVDDAIEGHELIADAFVRGDAPAMDEAVRSHLSTIERRMVDELG
jgi:GntR family transcriptional repressor for pyruvate dehydrogenase complex